MATVAGGGHRPTLERRLAEHDTHHIAAVVSFGLAGALESRLAVGTLLIPWRVVTASGEAFEVSREIVARWLPALDGPSGPRLPRSAPDLVGTDLPVLTRAAKSDLAQASGAGAVDMESHVAAAYAERRGLPFAVLRVVSDDADHDLPPAVAGAMRPDGSVDIRAVLRSVARNPGQIPALIRTARDAGRAIRALGGVHGLLGPRLGFDL